MTISSLTEKALTGSGLSALVSDGSAIAKLTEHAGDLHDILLARAVAVLKETIETRENRETAAGRTAILQTKFADISSMLALKGEERTSAERLRDLISQSEDPKELVKEVGTFLRSGNHHPAVTALAGIALSSARGQSVVPHSDGREVRRLVISGGKNPAPIGVPHPMGVVTADVVGGVMGLLHGGYPLGLVFMFCESAIGSAAEAATG